MSAIGVLVADDHPVYREGLAAVLRGRAELSPVEVVGDGAAALARARADDAPAVMVLDLRLPGIDGLDVLEAVQREKRPTLVVVVSAQLDAATVHRAIAGGARGYLTKTVSGELIADAVVAASQGRTVLCPDAQTLLAEEVRARRAVDERPLLSPREIEVLRLAAEGRSTPEIAELLVVGRTTVKTHLQHVFEKLDVHDRSAAVAQAIRRGLLT